MGFRGRNRIYWKWSGRKLEADPATTTTLVPTCNCPGFFLGGALKSALLGRCPDSLGWG